MTMRFLDNFYNMPGYRPDIDGIRAFAVVTVLLYHAWPGLFGAAIMSVDVFFVISGYLITAIICRDVKKERFTYWQFYRRRILRILPPTIIIIAASLAAGYFLLTAEEYARMARNARAGAMFEANFSLMAESGYFDVDSAAKPLVHFWTLAIEEQFYIVYPLLLLLAASFRGKIAIVALLGAVSFLFGGQISEWLLGNPNVTHYYSPFPRAFDLCAGALLALLTRDRGDEPPRFATIYAAAGTALVVFSCLFASPAIKWPSALTFLPVAGIVLLVYAGPKNPVSRVLLCNPFAVFVGLVSYELYLWHWPLLSFANILAGGPEHVGAITKASLLCLSLLLAYLVFAHVGLPLRTKYRVNTPANVILLCILALAGLCAHYIVARDGLPQRIAEGKSPKSWESAKVREDVARAAPHFPDWAKLTDGPNQVALEDDPDKIEVALIGDSHSFHLYPGLADALDEKVGVFPASGQAPYLGIATLTEGFTNYRKDGWKLTAQGYRTILENPNIKYVILGHNASCSIDDSRDPANPEERDATAIMERAVRQSLEKLRAAGKTVLVALDNPTLDFDPSTLQNRPLNFLNDKKARTVSRQKAEADRPRQWYNALVKKVARDFDNVHFVDLFDAFCDENECISVKDGQPLYFDRNHLTLAGSQFAAPLIAGALKKIKEAEGKAN